MAAHAITIDTDRPAAVDNHGNEYEAAAMRHRWLCSCGRAGEWKAARSARTGGARHVAAMERKR